VAKSKLERILNQVLTSEVEQTPIGISVKTGINHATTRKYLRRLLHKGKIVQPYKGSYCSKITHGMIFVPLRVHNVCVTSREGLPKRLFDVKVPDVVEYVGDVKMCVQHGTQRRKVSGKISCDAGMDRNAVLFALDRVFELWDEKFGVCVENDVLLKTFEVNRDYQGVRIDGPSCYTKKGLFGVIERIYQKEDDVVRHEFKVDKDMTIGQFQGLIQGGVSTFNLQQGLFMLVEEINGLKKTIMFQNEVISKQSRVLDAILNRIYKEKEG